MMAMRSGKSGDGLVFPRCDAEDVLYETVGTTLLERVERGVGNRDTFFQG